VILEARQFLRAIRGRRSQVAFSRRLGFRSNVCAKWESGARMPTASIALRACRRAGIDVRAALHEFRADIAELLEPLTDRAVAAWLHAQLGEQPIARVARRAKLSRFRVTRFLSGESRPRVPEFLALVQALSGGRLAEFVALLVDIRHIPELAAERDRLDAARRAVFGYPWTAAVLALLDTQVPSARAVDASFVARTLGLDLSMAEQCLGVLAQARVLRKRRQGYELHAPLIVDTRASPADALALRHHWARVSAERVPAPRPHDWFGYSVFAVSRADYAEIRKLYTDFYQRLRALIADSAPSEVAGVMVLHLLEWPCE
jgi:DNA-binding phage protein